MNNYFQRETTNLMVAAFMVVFGAGTLKGTAASIELDNIAGDGFTKVGFTSGSTKTGQYGTSSNWSTSDSNTDYAKWETSIPTAGMWGVELWWPTESNNFWANNASVTVEDAAGTTSVNVDQKNGGGEWHAVGIFDFNAAMHSVTINTTAGDGGYANADGIRFTDQLTDLTYGYSAGGYAMTTSNGTTTNILGATATFDPGAIVGSSAVESILLEITAVWSTNSNRSPDTLVTIYDG